jgi:hypothetical protein
MVIHINGSFPSGNLGLVSEEWSRAAGWNNGICGEDYVWGVNKSESKSKINAVLRNPAGCQIFIFFAFS